MLLSFHVSVLPASPPPHPTKFREIGKHGPVPFLHLWRGISESPVNATLSNWAGPQKEEDKAAPPPQTPRAQKFWSWDLRRRDPNLHFICIILPRPCIQSPPLPVVQFPTGCPRPVRKLRQTRS